MEFARQLIQQLFVQLQEIRKALTKSTKFAYELILKKIDLNKKNGEEPFFLFLL